MIHYHGTPIWPAEMVCRLLEGRHAFVSHARPEQIEAVAMHCQSFALDNGAFSKWKSNIETDWSDYYRFIERWCCHPGFDFALIPDVIDGDTDENIKLLNQWPFGYTVGTPVWHLHEDLSYLKYLLSKYPRVAFGSSGDFSSVNTQEWWNRIAEAMNEICDDHGRLPQGRKLHGLRMLNPEVFRRLPFASADSTQVAMRIADNSNPIVHKTTRGLDAILKIERVQSAPIWKKVATQIDLFNREREVS